MPLTTQGRPYLSYIPLPKGKETGLKENTWANCSQVLTIDKGRLVQRQGAASPATMEAIGRALTDTLELSK